jgi:NAD(P)-dependent dehydrogenase (short-subunit alcohol dehydrogenase family)
MEVTVAPIYVFEVDLNDVAGRILRRLVARGAAAKDGPDLLVNNVGCWNPSLGAAGAIFKETAEDF